MPETLREWMKRKKNEIKIKNKKLNKNETISELYKKIKRFETDFIKNNLSETETERTYKVQRGELEKLLIQEKLIQTSYKNDEITGEIYMENINNIFKKYEEIKITLDIPTEYAFMVGYGYVILDTKQSNSLNNSLNNSFVHYIDSVLNGNKNSNKFTFTFPSIFLA